MYDIIAFICIAVFVVGLFLLVRWMKQNKIIVDKNIFEDLAKVTVLLGLSIKVIDQLNLTREKDILKIAQIVHYSLEFATTKETDSEKVINLAVDYACDLCEQLDVEWNSNREELIRELIVLVIDKK
jgi:uncharacterized protein YqhQ